jgi:FMN reductase
MSTDATTRTIVLVTAGLGQPSSTRLLGDRLAAATDRALRLHGEQAVVHVVDLRELAHALTDNLLTGFPSGDLATAVERVREADGLIAVTPVFNASYSGLFKTFFDVLEQGTLDGTPVLMAATGGTARHSLALDYAMRPLFAHLRAIAVSTAVFGATEDFGSAGDGALSVRVERAGQELAALVAARPASETRAARATSGPTDPAELPGFTPFEELLGSR